MSNIVEKKSDLPLNLGYTEKEVILIRDTICKNATPDELKLFLSVSKRCELDPFSRQIHAVKRWNSKLQREEMAIQIAIDGYRSIADRTGAYAGSDEPQYLFKKDGGYPTQATVTVKKIVQGLICSFTATAYWDEFYPGPKYGFIWTKMPRLMLAKVAEAQALRKAFPGQFAGTYIPEEVEMSEADIKEHNDAVLNTSKDGRYAEKSILIDEIKRISGTINENKTQKQKADFIQSSLRVSSFKDLIKKTELELQDIKDSIIKQLEEMKAA